MKQCSICLKPIPENELPIVWVTKTGKDIICCPVCGEAIQIASESEDLAAVEKAYSYLAEVNEKLENGEAKDFLLEVLSDCVVFLSEHNSPPSTKSPKKFCSECGKPMNAQDTSCPSCGYSEQSPLQPDEQANNEQIRANKEPTRNNHARIARIIAFCIMAISILISFETAADLIAKGGEGISDISSVGGRTLEEAYYYELGFIYDGYALVVKSVGRVFAALLLWMGVKK